MGVEHSRAIVLPDDINLKYETIKQNWTENTLKNINCNKPKKGEATLSNVKLQKAADFLVKYLESNIQWIGEPKILEPFAGNGIASKIFYNSLIKKFPNTILKSTDVQNLNEFIDENLSHPVEFGLNSVETIEKYGDDDYNILMMISPPYFVLDLPNPITGYADYFAIKKWTQLENKKLIVFVGELGASDGSEGLYKYMLEDNSEWKLDFREIFNLSGDISGGRLEKEIFIFKRI